MAEGPAAAVGGVAQQGVREEEAAHGEGRRSHHQDRRRRGDAQEGQADAAQGDRGRRTGGAHQHVDGITKEAQWDRERLTACETLSSSAASSMVNAFA